jgi:hypothetical protein
MLGVRPPGVTETLHALREQGLIAYGRGQIVLKDCKVLASFLKTGCIPSPFPRSRQFHHEAKASSHFDAIYRALQTVSGGRDPLPAFGQQHYKAELALPRPVNVRFVRVVNCDPR